MAPAPPDPPANVVVVLLDSLNRHMLGSYGGTEFATPNLDLAFIGPFDLSPIVGVVVLLVAAGLVNNLIEAIL